MSFSLIPRQCLPSRVIASVADTAIGCGELETARVMAQHAWIGQAKRRPGGIRCEASLMFKVGIAQREATRLAVEAAKAAGQGDVATLKRLIKQGLDVNYVSKETKGPWGTDTMTLLTWAALKESAAGAETLLKAGADPNKATRRGLTPLMLASASRSDELFQLLLIRYKADPNKIFGIIYFTNPLQQCRIQPCSGDHHGCDLYPTPFSRRRQST